MTKKFGFTAALGTALIIALMILGSRAMHVSALENTPAPEKHYISYEVQPGDSLWALAEERCQEGGCSISEYIAEVKKVNHLTSDRIYSGRNIFLIVFE